MGEVNTRRYHGRLVAALTPPVDRTLLIASLDTRVQYGAEQYHLSSHEFGDGTVDPKGYLRIESFHLDRGTPVWRYAIADALLERRLMMPPAGTPPM